MEGGLISPCPGTSPTAASRKMGDIWTRGDTERGGGDKREFSKA